ncbi:hypothetical protein AMTR_s00010p00175790 [Amborella trichopoda]|uniref:VQ domain-containing protein n=2 Tax=Amborella trichopoda TaxID=13333 RepID=W1NFD0_AMBTC|nr:hypothetical protein AMTR_s00010p00175790 [Amborella trichopoda]
MNPRSNPLNPTPLPYLDDMAATHQGGGAMAQTSGFTATQIPVKSGGKKRSRASRRAPTTVLTTDTTNFRAMVQEFTGIPNPPFSSSPFQRASTRFDFIGGGGGSRSEPAPPFLLRPFPQKPSPPLSSSNSISGSSSLNIVSSNADIVMPNYLAASSSSQNVPVPQLPIQMQGPPSFVNFHPVLSHNAKFMSPMAPMPGFLAGKGQIPADSRLKSGVLEGFGSDSGQIGGASGHGHGQTGGPRPDFVSGGGGSRGGDLGYGGDEEEEGFMRSSSSSVAANNYFGNQRNSSCKLNYSVSSSSDFHVEKGSENVGRGEGMVDSWICSSD